MVHFSFKYIAWIKCTQLCLSTRLETKNCTKLSDLADANQLRLSCEIIFTSLSVRLMNSNFKTTKYAAD